MELLLASTFLAWFALSSGNPVGKTSGLQKHFITQHLDHYNDSDTRTWQMRYFSNNQFFVDEGPILITIECPFYKTSAKLIEGHFYDMAEKINGHLFQVQPRYYEESRPTSDLSLSNLAYLTINQTLADIAYFITHIKNKIPKLSNSKVIIRGSGYFGTLAVWLKRKYPKLVNGVWASNAPILAKADLKEYAEVVGENVQKFGSKDCYNRIESGIKKLEDLIKSNLTSDVRSRLSLPNGFDEHNEEEVGFLFAMIPHFLVQNIKQFCESIMKEKDDLTAVINTFLSDSDQCHHHISYTENLSLLKNSTYFDGWRQWTYQICNELGWFTTSESPNQPFGTKFPLSFYVKMCADVFGANFTISRIRENIDRTNTIYGGRDIFTTNCYFTQGQYDPMRDTQMIAGEGVTIFANVSFVEDFGSIHKNDGPELRQSKETLFMLAEKWTSHEVKN